MLTWKFKEKIVEAKRINDRVIWVKIVLDKQMVGVIDVLLALSWILKKIDKSFFFFFWLDRWRVR